jgi:hypothetical protein
MKLTRIQLACLASLLCGACASTGSDRPEAKPNAQTTAAAPADLPRVLYSRDGKPVMEAPAGEPRGDQALRREINAGEGGRATLLELYTTAMANRTALIEEVSALRATLEGERKTLTESGDERTALRAELAKVSRERDALKAETLDLAARLTTAQIARLEAEKALLEMQIDARLREEAAASVKGSSKDKNRAGGEHK